MTIRYINNKSQYLKIFRWFLDAVENIDFSDSGYYLEFEDASKRRSKLLNRYLWGWVYKQLSVQLQNSGVQLGGNLYSSVLIHARMQANHRVIGTFIDEKGQEIYIFKSTSDMTNAEMVQDIANINQFYIENHNIAIPGP